MKIKLYILIFSLLCMSAFPQTSPGSGFTLVKPFKTLYLNGRTHQWSRIQTHESIEREQFYNTGPTPFLYVESFYYGQLTDEYDYFSETHVFGLEDYGHYHDWPKNYVWQFPATYPNL